jgi:hypothetical protein
MFQSRKIVDGIVNRFLHAQACGQTGLSGLEHFFSVLQAEKVFAHAGC